MEFKYHANQNQRTPSIMSRPFSTIACVPGNSLGGSEYVPSGFSGNVPSPNVFPMPVPVKADEAFQRELEQEQIRRELEKEEIRRKIFAEEMTLARRRELEEEVWREMALGSPLGNSFQEPIYVSFNQRQSNMGNNIKIFDAPQFQFAHQLVDTKRRTLTSNNGNNMHILAKPNFGLYGTKRKAVLSPTIDNSNNSPLVLPKKPKQEWSCALCQITTTSEKGLNDHLQGKKHKAKEASLRFY